MANELMSQDEIDALMKNITSGELDDAGINALTGDDKNEVHRVNTAVDRLYFAYENGLPAKEIKYRQWFLHNEAHRLWLKHHGYNSRQEWQEKVIKHFILHPEHYQLLMLKKMRIYREVV